MSRPKSLDDLIWSSPNPVEPGAVKWDRLKMPDPKSFRIRRPPANSSPETAAELEELHRLTQNRTAADIEEILHWSVQEPSVNTHWLAVAEQACKAFKLPPPAGVRVHCLLAEALYCAMIALWRQKWRYLRPRPTDLDPTIDVSIIPVPQHPAYPSGHSTAGGAAAQILASLFPSEADRFWSMAEESGIARMKAGIHYRSDHEVGLSLGRYVAKLILKEAGKDSAPEHWPQ